MKRPSRMRKEKNQFNMDSSAFEVYSISSDSIESPYTKRLSNNGLVSARYTRTVKFTIPEKNKLKLRDINENRFTNGLKSDANGNQENAEENIERFYDLGRRRMSAPELPPIANTGKTSALISNGLVLPKSNTFHRLNIRTGRKSIRSDSSINGYRLNSQSRTSSSSSQKSRGRVLSAGTDRQTSKQLITADLSKNIQQPAVLREESTTMRNGASTGMSQRCPSVNGLGRQKSKYSLKENASTSRPLPHSRSDAQLTARTPRNNEIIANMRRNHSDKSLTDSKHNAKNHLYSKIPTHKLKNGIRYGSTTALNMKDEKGNDDGDDNDSDTDSEKDQRVMKWILGVTDYADPPEEPLIEHVDEPPQRDTAIRIVYNGDS